MGLQMRLYNNIWILSAMMAHVQTGKHLLSHLSLSGAAYNTSYLSVQLILSASKSLQTRGGNVM